MKKKNESKIQDFVSDYYEEYRYQKRYSRSYHDWWNNKMLSFVSLNGRILDNGCGTGNSALLAGGVTGPSSTPNNDTAEVWTDPVYAIKTVTVS